MTIRILNTTLPNSNIHDKYNENIDVGSEEPITTETYTRPSNNEKYSFCLFLAYFIHLVVENNHILEPLLPLHVGLLIFDVFGGVYGNNMVPFEVNIENDHHNR